MEPARKFQPFPRWEAPTYQEDEPDFSSGDREVPEWETKLGKTIFYITVALSIWFFYWLNGIQCPC
ncbi:MAG TPA: hypothetical protein VLA99_01700 [Nitrospiraceae bacterium]|mgnify:CR=1 FL=1|uniref:Uncharacterized protein n=1 Tax=Nitrospira tepida TaxID=2973512 RepID=A0AA86MY14_9BACT|nr:hypothetical protein [Nitrospira tepida]CAI4031160.1 hypothetical protein DNFV4_01588 [Nitrospira tepida]HSE57392.1 hypothetical protein [Nitrospiraceae bacterium]